jgi:hypothetical protein
VTAEESDQGFKHVYDFIYLFNYFYYIFVVVLQSHHGIILRRYLYEVEQEWRSRYPDLYELELPGFETQW